MVREEAAGGRAALAVPCVVGGTGRRAMCETAVSLELQHADAQPFFSRSRVPDKAPTHNYL